MEKTKEVTAKSTINSYRVYYISTISDTKRCLFSLHKANLGFRGLHCHIPQSQTNDWCWETNLIFDVDWEYCWLDKH